MKREVIQVGQRNSAILRGEEDRSVWSEEELIRGQRRSASGRWQGSRPKVVPTLLHDELVKRKMTKAYELLSESVLDAVQVLVDVAKDQEADPNVRIKAATEILNRTVGKPKENVHLQLGPKSAFEEFGEAVVVWVDDGATTNVHQTDKAGRYVWPMDAIDVEAVEA